MELLSPNAPQIVLLDPGDARGAGDGDVEKIIGISVGHRCNPHATGLLLDRISGRGPIQNGAETISQAVSPEKLREKSGDEGRFRKRFFQGSGLWKLGRTDLLENFEFDGMGGPQSS